MVVNCTQTTYQKETINLINDFFSSVDTMYRTGWGTTIVSRLFGVTGIKFDKPFMAEVFEGSFTTSSLLKKYPINASQVMYIFTMCKGYNYCERKTCYEVTSTRVYHHGKVYTLCNDNLKRREEYFDDTELSTYFALDEYNTCRQKAIKTLVLVANKENVIERENRKPIVLKKYDLAQDIFCIYDWVEYTAYKTHRVKSVEKEDDTYWVTLRNGIGKKYKYQNSNDFEPFDKSGYCVVAFRKSLAKRLEDYKKYSKLRRVAKSDFLQELQTRYDEIIVLKNLIATSIINTTNSETFRILYDLMGETVSDVQRHERIISKLEESREIYEKYKHEPFNFCTCDCYDTVDVVTKDFEHLDSSILYIRTKLFDNILQQDI